ncbi:MAG TPA: chemotaxis protein CheB [Verrucomicrobiae bacterium]|nr:chemotaxis protein CheB [Verrucomicrobiae bacterium]
MKTKQPGNGSIKVHHGREDDGRRFAVVVMGASAGGIDALSKVVRSLDPELPAAVLIVLHTSAYSALPTILGRASYLKVEHARDGQVLGPGQVLIAPPDRHLVLHDAHVVLSRGPKQNNMRPAIDPLFKSAARVYGPQVIAVILSGTLDDGSAGLVAVEHAGGVCIVQSPRDAAYPEMPSNALAAVKADHVLPAEAIGQKLNELLAHTKVAPMKKSNRQRQSTRTAEPDKIDPEAIPKGEVSTLTCPECGGTLWERREGNLLRFVCHTGHEFAAGSLADAQNNGVENALWVALRTLKERAMFVSRMAAEAGRNGRHHTQVRYKAEERELKERARLIQKVLVDAPSVAGTAINQASQPRGKRARNSRNKPKHAKTSR